MRERETSAGMTSKYGFSVVAPMSVTMPVSRAAARILLGFVPAVHFVYKRMVRFWYSLRRSTASPITRQFWNAGHTAEMLSNYCLRILCNQPRQRSFPVPGDR